MAVDIWSVGCILGELLTGKVLFPGKDGRTQKTFIYSIFFLYFVGAHAFFPSTALDQIFRIIQLLGTPSEETISKLAVPDVQLILSPPLPSSLV